MPGWLNAVLIAVILYALAAWGASRMMYYPLQYPVGNWDAKDRIAAQDVWIGRKLHGWFAKSSGSRFVTLHLHGNGGNITHRTLSAQHILDAGSSVLLLDYRGYGRSSGRPGESGLYEDAEAAYRWILSKGYAPRSVILHGESLGTAVAAHLATRVECAGLVLEAPFTSARAVAGRVLPVLGHVLMWGYDTKAKIKRSRVPVLIIHGDRDEVIAYEFGQELYAAAPGPKWFWTIPGATHNDLHIAGAPEFASRLKAFYLALSQDVVKDAQ